MVAKSNGKTARASGEKRLKGVRMRSWGKWVSEIRLPNTRARLWLGSYATADQAARAFDVAVVCLRGRAAALNFPESPPAYAPLGLPHNQIQQLAAAAAARVSPASGTADSGCHLGMPMPLLGTSPMNPASSADISDESDTLTSETSSSGSQSARDSLASTLNGDSAAVEEVVLLDERPSSAAVHKELLMSCEWDEAVWGGRDCWMTAHPVDHYDNDDDDLFATMVDPHCLWSL